MEHLKALRIRRGLTQSQVAELIGVSTVTIARYESGEREPSNDKLIKLAKFFNVSIDYLIGKNGEEESAKQSSDIFKELNAMLAQMDDDQLDKTAEYMRFVLSQKNKR